ncbi:hypothetical protein N7461_004354 [Penicillium sp. DV-2018c]|nr:hypothetical protein N7461_004354 [Penicillium sp. DV-2018c]
MPKGYTAKANEEDDGDDDGDSINPEKWMGRNAVLQAAHSSQVAGEIYRGVVRYNGTLARDVSAEQQRLAPSFAICVRTGTGAVPAMGGG